MIDRQTVERIQDTAKIEEVVGDFVSLRRRGANLIGLCPFHNEKTGSFTVSPARGIFKCFGCGEGGNSVHFIMKHEHLSYPDALRYLAKKYNIEIVEKELSEEEKTAISERDSLLNINEFAKNYFVDNLTTEEGRSIGLSYFYERGFTADIIKRFGLGYSLNSFQAFYEEAKKRSFSDDHIVKIGLAYRNDKGAITDRFRGRVMFPIHSLSGKIVGFGGRVLATSEKTAKYINSPESEIYHKSQELYGIFLAKNQIVRQDVCYLVEGYTDVISMHQAGVENVVASSGTSLTEGQIKLINRFTRNIIVIYDGDSAGIKASLRGINMLLSEGMNVQVVLLPEGEDPDSFARKINASDFLKYIHEHKEDFIRFKIRILQADANNDPIKKATMIEDIVNSIAIIPDPIVRATYAKESATLLDVDEQLIYTTINKIIRAKRDEEFRLKQRNEADISNATTKETDVEKYKPLHKTISPLYKHERELAMMVIKSGGKALIQYDNGKGFITLGEYICQILEEESIEIETPMFRQIFQDFASNVNVDGFSAEQFFALHSSPEISAFAAECLIDDKSQQKEAFPLEEAIEASRIQPKNLKELIKQKEAIKIIVEEGQRIEALKQTTDKIILEFFAAKINLEIKKKLTRIHTQPDIESMREYSEALTMRHNLMREKMSNRVIVRIK